MGFGGYCHQHKTEDSGYERKQVAAERKKAAKNAEQKLRKEFNPKAIGKGVDAELEKWFADGNKILDNNPYCENCGTFIPSKYYRAAQAHIYPKSIFKSVATHKDNRLFLGSGCGCHQEYDFSIESASKMRIWGNAVDRYKRFKNLITEHHKFRNNFEDLVNDNQ